MYTTPVRPRRTRPVPDGLRPWGAVDIVASVARWGSAGVASRTTLRYARGAGRSTGLPTAEIQDYDDVRPDDTDSLMERSMVAELLAQLPPRWSEILWRTVVLGEPLGVVAAKMGINPNAAAALNFRARAGLRRAYETQMAGEGGSEASGA